ncbi:MAG: hypothetical protein IRY90_11415 [Actinomadura rubrobrunea]|nr:hypothetical protein [Actinomadura rubrobrunea]
MKVPAEDQYKMLAAFERDRDALIKMFKEIFAFPYVEETRLVMLEAVTDLAGIGFDAFPNYEPFERAPLTEADRGSHVIRAGDAWPEVPFLSATSTSKNYSTTTCWTPILFVAEKLLVKWLSKLLKEVDGHDAFPYPICMSFQGTEPIYFDLTTGEKLRA